MRPLAAKGLYFFLQGLRKEPVRAALADVRRTENFSAQDLKALSATRQIEQLRFAVRHVPFYRDVYARFRQRIDSVHSPDEVGHLVSELPVVEREHVFAKRVEIRSGTTLG